MALRPDFTFSQNNLQDYLDCPRRFELRHVLRQEWPALESEPVLEMEHRAEIGRQFHRLVQQSVAGLPEDVLAEQAAADLDLLRWWESFTKTNPLAGIPILRRSEVYLQAPFAGYHLVGTFDLLAVEPGQRAVIMDWKTSQKRASRSTLAARMQTRLYPLLLTLAGAPYNSGLPVIPENIQFTYWFPEFPDQPETFQVNRSSLESDICAINTLITEINIQDHSPWLLTADTRRCKFCIYRSLCERGDRAGDGLEEGIEISVETDLSTLDLNQIGEIAL